MSRLFAYANAFDLPIIVHAEDGGLADGAAATAGETATRLGIPSAPSVAEALAVARDLMLAEQAGAHVHFRQLSTRASFDLIRQARTRSSEERRVGKECVSAFRSRWSRWHTNKNQKSKK